MKKRFFAIGLVALALSGCGYKGMLNADDNEAATKVFEDALPRNVDRFKLYGFKTGEQNCVVQYDDGREDAATFAVDGMPLYAFRSKTRGGHQQAVSSQTSPEVFSAFELTKAIQFCVMHLRPVDSGNFVPVEEDSE